MDGMKGISVEQLTVEEAENMFSFDEESCHRIPANTKHQLVYAGEKYIGIAVSKNGRQDFRRFGCDVCYTRLCDTFIGMREEI